MTWPLSQDYNEAIQNPRTNFSDPDLKRGEAATNSLGLPMPYSGNFADVYQVRCPDGSRWAVKCFTREAPGLRERYREISRRLRQANLPFTVDFTYLEQGIRVAGKWHPVLKMQWVEGQTFNQFVSRHLDKPAMMEALYQVWGRMATRLRGADVGHGDLQHGNVLLVPGANSLALKLIDYDGMWVPALAGRKSGEVGHPSYQHPRRLREGTYSVDVDRFPVLLIAAALRALKTGGRPLWDRYDNGDNLLFREIDLRTPDESTLFERLRTFSDPTTVRLTDALLTALQGEVESAPLLEEVLASARSAPAPASAVTTHRTAPPITSIAAPTEEEPPDYDGPPSRAPSRRQNRPRKKRRTRVPIAAVVGGAAAFAVVVLTFGIVALLAFGARPKEQETDNRVVRRDPVPPPAPRDPSPQDPAPRAGNEPPPGHGPMNPPPPPRDLGPAAPVEPNPAPPPAVNPLPEKQPPPATDFPGLISYWPFDDGNGNLAADLAQNRVKSLLNGVDWVDGVRGKAIAFRGRGSSFLFNGQAGLSFGRGASFTIAGWLQTTSTTHASLLSMRRSIDDSALIAIDVEADGEMAFFVRPDRQSNALAHVVAAKAAVNDGQWHHFALVRRIGADVEAYVDGELQAHTPAAIASGSITTDLRSLAVEQYNIKNPPLQFIGAVDEFCIFGRALTADEVGKLSGR